MLKNFDETKRQLSEFAPIINSFKSEAVQLRIIDLVFGIAEPARSAVNKPEGDDAQGTAGAHPSTGRAPRRKGRKAPKAGGANAKRRPKTGTPMSFLETIIDEGFFKKRHTIGQIVEHIRSAKARTFKPNEISGPLGRVVRNAKLKRERNADGQFEYYT